MYDFIYGSDYTQAIDFFTIMVVIDLFMEGSALVTDSYRQRLHPDFTISKFILSRSTAVAFYLLGALLFQTLANQYPETLAITPPAQSSFNFYQRTLALAGVSVLLGILYSFAGLSRFSSRMPNTSNSKE